MYVIKQPEIGGYWSLVCCSNDLEKIKQENKTINGEIDYRDIDFDLISGQQIYTAESYIREIDIGCDCGLYFKTLIEVQRFVNSQNKKNNILYLERPLRVL